MEIVAICSNKGGVGKSTSAISVASSLSLLTRVLLIDLDAQSHCALGFGLDSRSGVFDWLVAGRPFENCVVTVPIDGLLWLLPSDSRTKTVESIYTERPCGFDQVVEQLRSLMFFDWMVIDTAAGGLLQEAAIAAADQLIIPFEAETYGMDGIYGTLALAAKLNPDAAALLLPTSYDRRLKDHRDNLPEVVSEFGEEMVAEPVPARSAVKQATSYGQTIWQFVSPGLVDVRVAYAKLVDRIRANANRKEIEDGNENSAEEPA